MKIIPVIHYQKPIQLETNIKIGIDNNIKQFFLIDHSLDNINLINKAFEMKSKYNIWVGVNLLGMDTKLALSFKDIDGLDGLWCDSVLDVDNTKKYRTFKGQYFGSLAFKYQPQPNDLEQASLESSLCTDVSTTSGPGTGKEASFSKIVKIREYLKQHPMAIASGVNYKNIGEYKKIGVDYCLVASSIIDSDDYIIEDSLKKLLDAIK
jgi:predicted TIM-barrel enzyme